MSETPFGIPLRNKLTATPEEPGLSRAELAAEVGASASAVTQLGTDVLPSLKIAKKLRETL